MARFLLPLLFIASAATAQTTVPAGQFTNPIVKSVDAADPWVWKHTDGNYYFTATLDPDHGVWIWKTDDLTQLEKAERVKVWAAPKSGPGSRMIWAPEVYCFDGKWYVYFTASDGRDENHRHYVIESDAPLGPYGEAKLVDPELDEYAIDGSVLTMPDGKRYWMYCRKGRIEIAAMRSPTRVDGAKRVEVARATFPWERNWLEAPEALIRDGRAFVAYSAGHSGTPHYSLGLLTLKQGGDPMNPADWSKSPTSVFHPVFRSEGALYNVGHNGFTKSPDGKEDWIVYHAKDWRDNDPNGFRGRKARMQKFTWKADGTPDFGEPVISGVPLAAPSR